MNVQAQKDLIIEQFKQVNDKNLIKAIKSLLDYALEKDKTIYDVPDEHQRLVMDRYEEVHRNPKRLLDWEESKKSL